MMMMIYDDDDDDDDDDHYHLIHVIDGEYKELTHPLIP